MNSDKSLRATESAQNGPTDTRGRAGTAPIDAAAADQARQAIQRGRRADRRTQRGRRREYRIGTPSAVPAVPGTDLAQLRAVYEARRS